MKGCHSFTKIEKLKKNFEFRRTRNRGASYRDGVFTLTICKNDGGCHRLGLSISNARVPLASRRNRFKRLIREVFRKHKSELKGSCFDIIVSVKRLPGHKLDYSTAETRLLSLLKKARAL